MDAHLVGDAREVARDSLDGADDQGDVRRPVARKAPRGVRQRIRGGVDADREGVRPRARYEERIAPVSSTDVDDDAAVRAGACEGLTDVYVETPLADQKSHAGDVTGDGAA